MSLATEYLASMQADDNRNTWLARRNDVGQLIEFLRGDAALDRDGDVLWSKVEPRHVRSFVKWLKARKYTMPTIARKVSLVRCFLAWLHNDRKIELDPVLKALPPIKQSDFCAIHPVSPFDWYDVMRLVNSPICSGRKTWHRDCAMMALLAETACLSTEMLSLKMQDVDMELNTISFGGGVKLARNVQCDGPLWDIISEYWQWRRKDGIKEDSPLFISYINRPMSRAGLWLIVCGYAKQIGLVGMTPMSLRYSAIRQWQQLGRSETQIALDLGVFLTSNLRHTTLARSG